MVSSLPPCGGGSNYHNFTNCFGIAANDGKTGGGRYWSGENGRNGRYEGAWKDGQPHGQGTETDADGIIDKGTWRS